MARSRTHRAIHAVLFDVYLKEMAMDMDLIDLTDLGDATEETKQYVAVQLFPDSAYFWGLLPDMG
jgi:hypothetical protein